MMGATWGDDQPPRIQIPIQVTAADLADPEAFGARVAAAVDAVDPDGVMPVTIRTEVGPSAAAGPTPPTLAQALADLRQSLDQWHHGEAQHPFNIIDATRRYLAALDAEGADPP
jgi:hypothetical protein